MTSNDDTRLSDLDRTRELGVDAIGRLETRDSDMVHAIEAAEKKPDRREVIRIAATVGGVIGGLLGAVAIIISAINSSTVAGIEADRVVEARAESSANAEIRKQADNAYAEAQRANKILKQRGQKPISVPRPSAEDPAATIARAAVPIVLAELDDAGVSVSGIADRVAAYLRQNPVRVSTERLARLIADYLLENPPAPGRNGRDGVSPVIRAQDIVDAVNVVCAQQPGGSCEGEPGQKGDDGPAGRSVTGFDIRDLDPAPLSRECVYVQQYSDGTEEPEQIDDTVCEDATS